MLLGISFIGFSFVLGVVSALAGNLLDDLMKYGEIFYKLRLWRVKRSIKKLGYNYDRTMKDVHGADDFTSRQVMFEEVSWQLALDDYWLAGWICKVCITHRINLLTSVFLVYELLKYQTDPVFIFICVVSSFGAAHYVINKI